MRSRIERMADNEAYFASKKVAIDRFPSNTTLKKYNLTKQQYNTMFSSQNGLCAICFQTNPKKRLAIDHCHVTGLVRGLLCQNCNTGLGLFKDTTLFLKNAARYIDGFKIN